MENKNDDSEHPALNMRDIEMRFKIMKVLNSDPTPEEVAIALRAIDAQYPYDPLGDYDDA